MQHSEERIRAVIVDLIEKDEIDSWWFHSLDNILRKVGFSDAQWDQLSNMADQANVVKRCAVLRLLDAAAVYSLKNGITTDKLNRVVEMTEKLLREQSVDPGDDTAVDFGNRLARWWLRMPREPSDEAIKQFKESIESMLNGSEKLGANYWLSENGLQIALDHDEFCNFAFDSACTVLSNADATPQKSFRAVNTLTMFLEKVDAERRRKLCGIVDIYLMETAKNVHQWTVISDIKMPTRLGLDPHVTFGQPGFPVNSPSGTISIVLSPNWTSPAFECLSLFGLLVDSDAFGGSVAGIEAIHAATQDDHKQFLKSYDAANTIPDFKPNRLAFWLGMNAGPEFTVAMYQGTSGRPGTKLRFDCDQQQVFGMIAHSMATDLLAKAKQNELGKDGPNEKPEQ